MNKNKNKSIKKEKEELDVALFQKQESKSWSLLHQRPKEVEPPNIACIAENVLSDGTSSSEDDDESNNEDTGNSDDERMSWRRIKKPRVSLGVKGGDDLIICVSALASILNKTKSYPCHCD